MLQKINIYSSVPVYEQIENEVRFAIASGAISDGDQIPAVQALARTLGINFNTVTKAYRTLEVMGLIYTRRGMGCFIEKGARPKCQQGCRKQIFSKLHEVTQEAKASGMTKKSLTQALDACYAVEAGAYEEPSAALLKLAKKL